MIITLYNAEHSYYYSYCTNSSYEDVLLGTWSWGTERFSHAGPAM